MKELILNVEGMMCSGCEKRIENALSTIEGINKVIANHENATVTINLNNSVDEKAVKEKIESIGFIVK